MLIILGDFFDPQDNCTFLLLRYVHRAYELIDDFHFLHPLSVYPYGRADVNLVYKAIQNFGRQFGNFGIAF